MDKVKIKKDLCEKVGKEIDQIKRRMQARIFEADIIKKEAEEANKRDQEQLDILIVQKEVLE